MRVNLIGSFQKADYDNSLALASIAASSAWFDAINLYYSPVQPIYLGIEFRHGERTLVSGVDRKLDRIALAVKYGF